MRMPRRQHGKLPRAPGIERITRDDHSVRPLLRVVTKTSPGCRRDFRVKMWGTSSPDDKLTGDLAKATEATKIAGRRSDRLMAGKLSPRNFGLLQQYRHEGDMPTCVTNVR